jgi:hypothetical protein
MNKDIAEVKADFTDIMAKITALPPDKKEKLKTLFIKLLVNL